MNVKIDICATVNHNKFNDFHQYMLQHFGCTEHPLAFEYMNWKLK